MSAAHVTAQEMSNLYTDVYCVYAACAILVFDWFLSLGQEVRFIWNWHSKVTGSSLVYAFSRYAVLIQSLLIVATVYPMSDLSCTANVWAQTGTGILGGIAFSAFSAMRAYALSNRNLWLTAIIILLALPPTAIFIPETLYEAPINLPSPFNCSSSASLPQKLSLTLTVVTRASQLMAELLVVGITWWYTYQSYRLRRGIKIARSINSVLVYNGSIYFLFLATLYILDIIFHTASVPDAVLGAGSFLVLFYDPITSILVCHFMLSLREFDSSVTSATYSGQGSRIRDLTASTVFQFAAQPCDTLPSFIASFAHPVHVDSSLSETDSDEIVDDVSDWREMEELRMPTRTTRTPSCQSPAADQPSGLARSV